MGRTLKPAQTQAVPSRRVEKSESFSHTLRRTTAFTGRLIRQGDVGFIGFIEEVPALMAWGSSRGEAEGNLKKRFAGYVARERSLGKLCGEIQVLWME